MRSRKNQGVCSDGGTQLCYYLWVIARTCPPICIRPNQSFASDLTSTIRGHDRQRTAKSSQIPANLSRGAWHDGRSRVSALSSPEMHDRRNWDLRNRAGRQFPHLIGWFFPNSGVPNFRALQVSSYPRRPHVPFASVLSIQDANDGDNMHHSSQPVVLTVDSEHIRQAQPSDRLKLTKVLQWFR